MDNINWQEYDLSLLDRKPEPLVTTNIFYLYYNDLIVYIGHNANLHSALKSSHKDKVFTSCKYFTIPYEDRETIHRAHVWEHSPFYNKSFCDPDKYRGFIELEDGYFADGGFISKSEIFYQDDHHIVSDLCQDPKFRKGCIDYQVYNILDKRLRRYSLYTHNVRYSKDYPHEGKMTITWCPEKKELFYLTKGYELVTKDGREIKLSLDYVFPFGRYKNKTIHQVRSDISYLTWYWDNVIQGQVK